MIHQLGEPNNASSPTIMELKDANGNRASAIPQILQQMQERVRREQYRKPDAVGKITIPTELLNANYGNANPHIHPKYEKSKQRRDLHATFNRDMGVGLNS